MRCYCPVPVSVAVCGLLGALSLTCRVPFWTPLLVGEKRTLMVQFAPTPKLVPHVVDGIENWLAFVPPMRIELIVSNAVPELVSVKVVVADERRATVPKLNDVGLRVTRA